MFHMHLIVFIWMLCSSSNPVNFWGTVTVGIGVLLAKVKSLLTLSSSLKKAGRTKVRLWYLWGCFKKPNQRSVVSPMKCQALRLKMVFGKWSLGAVPWMIQSVFRSENLFQENEKHIWEKRCYQSKQIWTSKVLFPLWILKPRASKFTGEK